MPSIATEAGGLVQAWELGRQKCNVFDAIARAVAHRGSRPPAVATTA